VNHVPAASQKKKKNSSYFTYNCKNTMRIARHKKWCKNDMPTKRKLAVSNGSVLFEERLNR
jgi:hypothetical protein